MKKLLLLAFIASFIAAILFKEASFFVLSIILLIFVFLEFFQTEKEKSLSDWHKEVKETQANDIEDWHRMDYNNIDNNKN